ncbi:MAG: hypothetical protein MI923_02915 [Phycisphaerales bacterium]|nr:hypothetical protein [Phycisphaerales bacterium]
MRRIEAHPAYFSNFESNLIITSILLIDPFGDNKLCLFSRVVGFFGCIAFVDNRTRA